MDALSDTLWVQNLVSSVKDNLVSAVSIYIYIGMLHINIPLDNLVSAVYIYRYILECFTKSYLKGLQCKEMAKPYSVGLQEIYSFR